MRKITVLIGLLFALSSASAYSATFRYVRVTTLTGYDFALEVYTSPFASCGEMRLSNGGSPISPSGHSVTASDEMVGGEEASNVLDANTGTHWHSDYDPTNVPHPHTITYDAGTPTTADRILWTDRTGAQWGSLGQYEIHGSNDGLTWTALGSGTAQTGAPANGGTLTLMFSGSSSRVSIIYQQMTRQKK